MNFFCVGGKSAFSGRRWKIFWVENRYLQVGVKNFFILKVGRFYLSIRNFIFGGKNFWYKFLCVSDSGGLNIVRFHVTPECKNARCFQSSNIGISSLSCAKCQSRWTISQLKKYRKSNKNITTVIWQNQYSGT